MHKTLMHYYVVPTWRVDRQRRGQPQLGVEDDGAMSRSTFGRVASLVGHALETHPFALAGFVRLCMLAYGAWMDATLELKYTDIDYRVFTDGAELVTKGRCPF